MHWQLPPNHPEQLPFGIQWVHTGTTWHGVVDTSSKVAFHRLESLVLAIRSCIHSDNAFPVRKIIFALFEAVSPRRACLPSLLISQNNIDVDGICTYHKHLYTITTTVTATTTTQCKLQYGHALYAPVLLGKNTSAICSG